MSEILNIAGLHNEGKPELLIGIRDKKFKISLNSENNTIEFSDKDGNILSIDPSIILNSVKMVLLDSSEESSTPSVGDIPIFTDKNTIGTGEVSLEYLKNQITRINSKANKATTLSGYNINDAYTKTEIDAKLSGALHYKGSYNSFTALQAAVNDGSITPNVGDVYNIKTAGGNDEHGVEIKSGDNVICVSFTNEPTPTATWDVSSGTIDLSNYTTNEQMESQLASTKAEIDKNLQTQNGDIETAKNDISNLKSQNEQLSQQIDSKAEKSTSLSGYGISDAYTKTEINSIVPKITVKTTAPGSGDTGKVGDLWIVYE